MLTRRRFLRGVVLGSGAALLAACAAPAATPTTAPKPSDPSAGSGSARSAAPAAPSGATQFDDLVAAARQEGEVVVFLGRAGSRQIREAIGAFEKRFGIKATAVVGSGNENADKVLAERDAGLYTGDIWTGGLTSINSRLIPKGALDPIEPYFVLPEVTDKSLWWKGRWWWGDPQQKIVFLFAASPGTYLTYNTNLAKEADIQSWWDLLDPKWKGKIVSRDPGQAGVGGSLLGFYFHPQMGPEFLRRVYLEQEIAITRDGRQGAEWLSLGKYAFYFNPGGNDSRELRDQGMPVDEIVRPMKEGARLGSGGTGTLSVFNRPAHPNAARLYINWWLSKEGQAAVMKANPEDETLREDVSKEDVKPEYRRQPGVDYLYLDSDPEILARESEPVEFMKKVLEEKR